MPEAWKRCACGKQYTLAEWRALARIGIMTCPPGDDESFEGLELRNCPDCGSTLSKRIPYPGGTQYPPPRSRRE